MSNRTLRLRPKKSAQRFRFGAPWIFKDEVVLDRRTRAIEAGSIVEVVDHEKRPFALAAFNAESKIVGRILELDVDATIDAAWFDARLRSALAHRERHYDAPYYRLVHAEADGLPGIIIDRFGSLVVVQPNAAYAEKHLDTLHEVLVGLPGIDLVYKNAQSRGRSLEGLDDVSAFIGDAPSAMDPLHVPMNGATYIADITGGQKTGLFYDQRDNHAYAARLAKGTTLLDVFSHVGGFSLAALAGGASSALAIDGSEAALGLALQGAAASDVAARFTTRQGDAVALMRELDEEAQRFGVVVCDPPAFAPHKGAKDAGKRGYEKVALHGAKLVEPGGYLVLCSCSHAVNLDEFHEVSVRGIGRAGRRAQLIHTGGAGPDHPQHLALRESGYLKALFFRLLG